VSVLGLRVLIGLIQPVIPAVVTGPWLCASVVILIWQLVGSWRAADVHLRDGGGMVLLWCSYGAMVIALALAVLQWLDAVAARAPPAVAPLIAPMQLPLDSRGRIVTLSGPLSWPMHSALEGLLQEPNHIRTVNLDSTGGLVFAARALANLIEGENLDTHVDGRCLSACTLVFMAGQQRSVGISSELGFHQYAIDEPNRVQTISVTEELAKDRAYFQRRGASAAFVESVFQASPEQMWIPTHAQLQEAGVLRTCPGSCQ
jgi:hypothetical protein